MTLKEKLDLLENLSAEEKEKVKEKFIATLGLIDGNTMKSILSYLKDKSCQITKAREIKVLANPADVVIKKFSILEEIHETDIFRKDPRRINNNVIDIYKKIQYCRKINKPYKKEDGTYEDFLFDTIKWQEEFTVEKDKEQSVNKEEELITLEPNVPKVDKIENIEVNNNEVSNNIDNKSTNSKPDNVISFDGKEHIDIEEYQKDMQDLDAKTTDFATIKRELEGQLAELDALKNMNTEEEIGFNDLEPESYRMGISA